MFKFNVTSLIILHFYTSFSPIFKSFAQWIFQKDLLPYDINIYQNKTDESLFCFIFAFNL